MKHHHYSRTQRLVQALCRYAEENDVTGEEAVQEFEKVFKEKKCSLSVMVKHMQSIGLMSVRVRPTQQSQSQQQTDSS